MSLVSRLGLRSIYGPGADILRLRYARRVAAFRSSYGLSKRTWRVGQSEPLLRCKLAPRIFPEVSLWPKTRTYDRTASLRIFLTP